MEAPKIELETVLDELDIAHAREALAEDWEQSQQWLPTGTPYFLAADYVTEACADVWLPGDFVPDLLAAAEVISANQSATALSWHAHWWMFEADDANIQRVRSWPRLTHSLGPPGGLLYLLALLSGVDEMYAIHRDHEVPEDVTRDTLSQIALYLRETRERQGYPELTPHLAGWLMNHFTGILYRLARLQFQFGTSRYRIRVFRNLQTDQVVALSEDGVRYRPDGQILRDRDPQESAWTARLRQEGGEITGFPIHPAGRALTREIHLDADRWRQVLAPGDPVLHIHIPGGEPMYYERCGEAFERALEFFPRHFPEREWVAFTCGSWILNTAIRELLREDSNLVRFQREVYLFPIGLSDDSLPGAIFDEMPEDLSEAPRQTSLQRAYIDAMQAGGLVTGGGGCFLLPEDVAWGRQVYLSQEMPW
ncbi:MAG: acyltransferase domain-containing protein [Armatimonadota bacterium]